MFARASLILGLGIGAVAGAQTPGRARAAPVRGVVFDSVRGRPLPNAFISVVGEGKTAVTDARGRFAFDSVASGRRTFVVQHASLDTIGLSGVSREAEIGDSLADVRLGLPSFATFWRNACGARRPPSDSAIVYGTIRDVTTQAPVSGATVTLAWSEYAFRDTVVPRGGATKRLVERRWRSEVRTSAGGGYAFCGAPLHAVLRLAVASHAPDAARASGPILLETGDLRVHRQDATIGHVGATAARGLIVGSLMAADGEPFADARVMVDDSLEVRSEFDGRFVFANAPTGSHQLLVRYIGAAPVRMLVDVVPNDTTLVVMTMSKITRLTTMNVTSPQRARMLLEDYEVRRISYQRFMLDSSFVGKQTTMANVFQTSANVTVKRYGAGDFTLLMPDRRGGSCVPDLRVDGVLINDFGQLNAVPPSRVVAVEVYPFSTSIPSEYARGGIRYECGLVSVWTKWAFRIP